jgi:hypothetical protein
VRLPYTSTTSLAGSTSSTDAAIDSTGVMPLPAATSPTVRRAAGSSTGPNRPAGGSTSSSSPGRSPVVTHVENAPPSSCLTATRSGPPALLLQIE